MKPSLILIMLLALPAVFNCSNDSNLIFPEKKEIATISGFVEPAGVRARVYLLDAKPVDSTITDSASGFFVFDSVPYGSYQLKVIADSFGMAKITFSAQSPLYSFPNIVLKKRPSQISSVTPDNNTVIKGMGDLPGSNDTTAVISIIFNRRMDTASFAKNISFTPQLSFKVLRNAFSDPNHFYTIGIPLVKFFAQPSLSMMLGGKIKSVYGETLDFDYTVSYFPDTAFLTKIITSYFITQTAPVNNTQNVDPNTAVVITFKREMNRSSAEQLFSTLPANPPTFTWTKNTSNPDLPYDILTVRYFSPLQPNTRYTVALDSGVMSLDSLVMKRRFTLSFTTNDLTLSPLFPGNGQSAVALDSPFTYFANFAVDSSSFAGAFSIKPGLSMLDFSITKDQSNNSAIKVYHSPLSVSTNYAVTIDSTVKSITGIKLQKKISVSFTTLLSYPDSLLLKKSFLIASTSPASTQELIDCNRSIIINFRKPMNKTSVEQRCSFVPAALFIAEWPSDGSLSLKPSQQFRSNTAYALMLDSGFQTVDNLSGNTFKLVFKTKPLTILSFDPVIGQINVSRSAPVYMKFNGSADTSTLLSNIETAPKMDSLYVQTVSATEYRIRHASLLAATRYTVTFKNTITDLYGSAMDKSYSLTFTTGN